MITTNGRRILCTVAGLGLILAGALAVLLPMSPAQMAVPPRDSGVFLYTGWRITQGEIPYRDVWDHKPPLIYFIDAFGLSLTPGSRWGVWGLEVLCLSTSALLLYRLVRRLNGTIPAVLSSFLFLLSTVFVIDGGNLTTEYAIPLQIGILSLAENIDLPSPGTPNRSSLRHMFWIGVLAGALFFMKQNTVGAAAAVVLAWLFLSKKFGDFRSGLVSLLALIAGGLAVCLPIILYFVMHGAGADFWSDAFFYNLVYSSVRGLSARAFVLRDALVALGSSGLMEFGLIGFGLGLWRLLRVRDHLPRLIFLVLILDLPLEFFLVICSGRSFPHYFLSLLPVLAVWAGWAFQNGIKLLDRFVFIDVRWRSAITIVLAAILVANVLPAYFRLAQTYRNIPGQDIVTYIDAHTDPGDPILMWGAQTTINFLAARPSPTRFVYQYPLYDEGYGTYEMFCEYLNAILTRQPRLIIDTHAGRTPFLFVPINGGEVQRMVTQIRARYTLTTTISGWDVYELKENQ
jgi:4-amino-4-deoxy-L-arabinose transferase-like glycosyltransferase